MITTVSGYPEAEMGEKDLSPQQSLLTHSYDEEEFDIPQVFTIVGDITQEVGTENGRFRSPEKDEIICLKFEVEWAPVTETFI